MKKSKKLYNLFFFGSILLFAISFWYVFSWGKDTANIMKLRNDIWNDTEIIERNSSYDLVNPPSNTNDLSWAFQEASFLEVDFTDLIKKNDETVAYIEVNGTNISYPVVKTIDNEFYLNHSFDKKKNKAGWIFLDYRNNFDDLSNNTIIYGHKVKNETMFSELNNLLNEEWFDNLDNHLINISTLKENTIWQIFSVYTIDEESYYLKTFFESDEEFQTYIDTILARSNFKFNTNTNINDKILTLSTCYNTTGKRIVIHAKLIKKGLHS